jgi:D-3-phosphoglycerate dehydrogenase
VPGVIGRIGAALGALNVNIATFALGRRAATPGAEALALIRVDGDVPEGAIDALRAIDAITEARRVRLPAAATEQQLRLPAAG